MNGERQFIFNYSILGVEAADAILLVCTTPRWDAPVLNDRIRKAWLAGSVQIAGLGVPTSQTFPVKDLGADVATLEQIANGGHPFAAVLRDAKRPMIVIGPSAVARMDGAAILRLAARSPLTPA